MASKQSKLASTEYDIHELIKKRWSPRAFADKAVDPGLLRQLFDAARWAPSSYNEQPWKFIVATKNNAEEYERISRVLNEKNQQWATSAPVLILTVTKNHFELNNRPNKHAEHDLGQAVSYLTFEATRHNLYVHQMAGILPDKARELFNIPGEYRVMTMIAIGHLGDPEQLPENFQKMERGKRSRSAIDEVAFRGSWKDPEKL